MKAQRERLPMAGGECAKVVSTERSSWTLEFADSDLCRSRALESAVAR